jgi:hypothetical protein
MTQQPDLFGGLHPVDDRPTPPRDRTDSNNIDLMHTVAGNAVRCGYLLVGACERVYTRTRGDEVARVPRYEEEAVHQLLRRRWLTLGAPHPVTCGAASLTGLAVLVPKPTRDTLARWERLQRPPSWPRNPSTTAATASTAGSGLSGRVVALDEHRRRRR